MVVAVASTDLLVSQARVIGETWAVDYVATLRDQERDIVGAWPGTVSEARRRVLARLPHSNAFEPELVKALACAAYDAARRSWQEVAEPDPES